MSFIRRFFSSASAVLGFAASIFQLLGIASVGSLLLPTSYKPELSYLIWSAIGLALMFGVASSVYTVVRAIRSILQRPLHPYDVLEERYELIVRTADVLQVTRLVLRFPKAGNFTHPHRYYWSGAGKPVIVVRQPASARYFEVGESQHWTVGQFVFSPIMRNAETVVLEFEHRMPKTTFQTYVSRITDEKPCLLTLKVRLEDGTSLTSVAQLVNRNPVNEGAAQSVPPASTGTGGVEHEWAVIDPHPNTQYMLGWTA